MSAEKTPASQTEGMGGDAVRKALEPFAQIADEYDDAEDDAHEVWRDFGPSRVIRSRLTLGNFRAARAALTPPETAEALKRVTQERDSAHHVIQILTDALGVQQRERDDAVKALESAAISLEQAAGRFNLMGGVGLVNGVDPKVGYAEAYEASRVARTSGPAPATDDRERLVEANHRLMNLLYLADEAIMDIHGCFPNDEATEEQRRLKQTCKAIRALTGEDYLNRKGRAAVARAALATETSR